MFENIIVYYYVCHFLIIRTWYLSDRDVVCARVFVSVSVGTSVHAIVHAECVNDDMDHTCHAAYAMTRGNISQHIVLFKGCPDICSRHSLQFWAVGYGKQLGRPASLSLTFVCLFLFYYLFKRVLLIIIYHFASRSLTWDCRHLDRNLDVAHPQTRARAGSPSPQIVIIVIYSLHLTILYTWYIYIYVYKAGDATRPPMLARHLPPTVVLMLLLLLLLLLIIIRFRSRARADPAVWRITLMDSI